MTVEGAKKAWETRRKNKAPKISALQKSKEYDSPAKNKFRKKVIEFFDKDKLTLALESPEFLFVDALPNCEFILFEHDYENYKKMVCGNRKNIKHVFNTDVSLVRLVNEEINQAYLDFCCTLENATPSIIDGYVKLQECDKLAITFCLRGNKKEIEDYKFDLLKKIQNLFGHFKLEYATSYKDGAPMVGILLTNKFKDYERDHKKPEWIKHKELEVFLWCEDYCRREWGIKLFDGLIRRWAHWNSTIQENPQKINELWEKLPVNLKNNVLLSYKTQVNGVIGMMHCGGKNLGNPDTDIIDYFVFLLLGFWRDYDWAVQTEKWKINNELFPYYHIYHKSPNDKTALEIFNQGNINDSFINKCIAEYKENHKGEFQ
jgi:hypothetical protein